MSASSVRMDYDAGYYDGVAETTYQLTQWLLAKGIIREQMFDLPGYVALDSGTGQPIEFLQVGKNDAEADDK